MDRSTPASRPPAWTRAIPALAGIIVVTVGCVALTGWLTDQMALTRWAGYGASMRANTALMAIACGIWLIVPARSWKVWPSLALGLPVLALASAMALEWIFDLSLGVDHLLVGGVSRGVGVGRSSLQMCAAFIAFALVILSGPIHRGRFWRRIPTTLGMIFLFTALTLELFIFYNAPNFTRTGAPTGADVGSAVVLMALALGVIGRHAGRRPHRWLWESGLAGAFSRRMVPVSVLIPAILGVTELVLIDSDLLKVRGALALITSLISFTLLLVIADTIRVVTRAEQERNRVAMELSAIFDSMPAVMAVRDLDGTIVRANSVLAAARNTDAAAMVGQPIEAFYPPEVVEILQNQTERIRETGRAETIDLTTTPPEGGVRKTELTQFPVSDPAGVMIGLGAIGIDVTKRQEAQDAADRATARLQAFLDSAPDATIVVDADATISFANAQTTTMLGYTQEELLGAPVETLVPPALGDWFTAFRERNSADPRRERIGDGIALTARHKDGHEIPVEVSLGPFESDGEVITVAVIRDVTEIRAAQNALLAAEEHYRYLAEHDPLTGLPNRRRFTDALEALVHTTPDSGALLAIDLDYFKSVNDGFGHEAGDRLLVAVAGALQSSIRGGDLLARIGGDEFLVLCPGCSAVDALSLADRLVAVVDEVAAHFGEAGNGVTASVGVVNMIDLEPADRTPKVALLRADIALYGAKSEGRGRSQVYVPAARSGEQARDSQR